MAHAAPSHPDSSPKCPACASQSLTDHGEIFHPRPAMVAGVPIDLGNTPYRLLACNTCKLWFKSPPVDEQRLLDCYAASAFSHWRARPDPIVRKFDELLALIKQFSPGADVLDIGCFNGAMLEYFGAEYRRFGIEPSREAAAVARERGVEVLGSTVMELRDTPRFDCVLAIDVLEHIVHPMPFFAKVAAILRPGGVFISLTGDVGAWGWKLLKARHAYCSLPEHVTFFSRASLGELERRVGLEEVSYRRIVHQRTGTVRTAQELVRNVAFATAVTCGGEHLPGIGPRLRRRAPVWEASADHLLHVGRKKAV